MLAARPDAGLVSRVFRRFTEVKLKETKSVSLFVIKYRIAA